VVFKIKMGLLDLLFRNQCSRNV